MAQDDNSRRKLYDAISNRYDDVGTYEQFDKRLDDAGNRKKLYDAISQDFDDIGTYSEFDARLRPDKPAKPDASTTGATTQPATTATPGTTTQAAGTGTAQATSKEDEPGLVDQAVNYVSSLFTGDDANTTTAQPAQQTQPAQATTTAQAGTTTTAQPAQPTVPEKEAEFDRVSGDIPQEFIDALVKEKPDITGEQIAQVWAMPEAQQQWQDYQGKVAKEKEEAQVLEKKYKQLPPINMVPVAFRKAAKQSGAKNDDDIRAMWADPANRQLWNQQQKKQQEAQVAAQKAEKARQDLVKATGTRAGRASKAGGPTQAIHAIVKDGVTVHYYTTDPTDKNPNARVYSPKDVAAWEKKTNKRETSVQQGLNKAMGTPEPIRRAGFLASTTQGKVQAMERCNECQGYNKKIPNYNKLNDAQKLQALTDLYNKQRAAIGIHSNDRTATWGNSAGQGKATHWKGKVAQNDAYFNFGAQDTQKKYNQAYYNAVNGYNAAKAYADKAAHAAQMRLVLGKNNVIERGLAESNGGGFTFVNGVPMPTVDDIPLEYTDQQGAQHIMNARGEDFTPGLITDENGRQRQVSAQEQFNLSQQALTQSRAQEFDYKAEQERKADEYLAQHGEPMPEPKLTASYTDANGNPFYTSQDKKRYQQECEDYYYTTKAYYEGQLASIDEELNQSDMSLIGSWSENALTGAGNAPSKIDQARRKDILERKEAMEAKYGAFKQKAEEDYDWLYAKHGEDWKQEWGAPLAAAREILGDVVMDVAGWTDAGKHFGNFLHNESDEYYQNRKELDSSWSSWLAKYSHMLGIGTLAAILSATGHVELGGALAQADLYRMIGEGIGDQSATARANGASNLEATMQGALNGLVWATVGKFMGTPYTKLISQKLGMDMGQQVFNRVLNACGGDKTLAGKVFNLLGTMTERAARKYGQSIEKGAGDFLKELTVGTGKSALDMSTAGALCSLIPAIAGVDDERSLWNATDKEKAVLDILKNEKDALISGAEDGMWMGLFFGAVNTGGRLLYNKWNTSARVAGWKGEGNGVNGEHTNEAKIIRLGITTDGDCVRIIGEGKEETRDVPNVEGTGTRKETRRFTYKVQTPDGMYTYIDKDAFIGTKDVKRETFDEYYKLAQQSQGESQGVIGESLETAIDKAKAHNEFNEARRNFYSTFAELSPEEKEAFNRSNDEIECINQGLADGVFTEEHARIFAKYRDAKCLYEGVVRKARQQYDAQVKDMQDELAQFTYNATTAGKEAGDEQGRIITAQVKVDGADPKNPETHDVYVISGDKSGEVMVLDMQSGKRFPVKEEELQNREEKSVGELIQAKEEELSHKLGAELEGNVTAALDEGKPLPILVDGEDFQVTAQPYQQREDGTQDYLVTFADGTTQRVMSEEELQTAYTDALKGEYHNKIIGQLGDWRTVAEASAVKDSPKKEVLPDPVEEQQGRVQKDEEQFRTYAKDGHEATELKGDGNIDGQYVEPGDRFYFMEDTDNPLELVVTGVRETSEGREFKVEIRDKETQTVMDERVFNSDGLNEFREAMKPKGEATEEEPRQEAVAEEQQVPVEEPRAEEQRETPREEQAVEEPKPVMEETPVDPTTGEKLYHEQPEEKTKERLNHYEKQVRNDLIRGQVDRAQRELFDLQQQVRSIEESKPSTDTTDLDEYDAQVADHDKALREAQVKFLNGYKKLQYWQGIQRAYEYEDALDADTAKVNAANEAKPEDISSGVALEEGQTIKDVAESLGVSEKEVENIDNIAKELGVRAEFADIIEGNTSYDNGQAGVKSRTVLISKNSVHEGKAVSFLFGHELTHVIRGNLKEQGQWDNYLNTVKTIMGDRFNQEVKRLTPAYAQTHLGMSVDTLWNLYNNAPIEEKAALGQKLADFRALVQEEVAANFAGELFTNREWRQKLGKQDYTTLEKVSDGIDNVMGRIFRGRTKLSPEMEQQIVEARTAFEAAKAAVTVTEEEAKHPELWRNEANRAEEKMHSIDTLCESAGLHYSKGANGESILTDKDGNRVESVDAEFIRNTPLGAGIKNSVKAGYISVEDGIKETKFFAQLFNNVARTNDLDMVFAVSGALAYGKPLEAGERPAEGEMSEDHGKSSRFSAFTSNSDPQYGTTFDVTTICLKTKAIIDAMSATMVKLDRGLTAKEVVDVVYKETAKAGETVPCPVCYVFSRWVGNGGILNNIAKWQEKYANTPVSEIRDRLNELDMEIEKKMREVKSANTRSKAKMKIIGYDMGQIASIIDLPKSTVEKAVNAGKIREIVEMAVDRIQYYDMYQEFGTQKQKDSQLRTNKKGNEFIDLTPEQREELNEWLDQIEKFNEYTWLKDVRLGTTTDAEGNEVSTYEPVDHAILFDFNRGKEFADKYPSAWKYRTTRGPSAGKAITPYAPEHFGQALRATDVKNVGDLSNNHYLEVHDGDWDTKTLNELARRRQKVRAQNLIGGQRMQSTSDFRPEYATDYLLAMIELQTAGSKVQLYTKVPEAVGFLASCGAEVNMSLMPSGNGWSVKVGNKWERMDKLPEEMQERIKVRLKGGDNPDDIFNDLVNNGEIRADFSSVTGMNEDDAFGLMDLYDNAQPIMVGTNDVHMRMMLADPRIPFIIPYHASGGRQDNYRSMMKTVQEMVNERDDYSPYQLDAHINGKKTSDMFNVRCKILSGGANGETTEEEDFVETDQEGNDVENKKKKENNTLTARDRDIIRDTWIDGHDGGNLYILHDLYKRFYGTDVDGNPLTAEDAARLHMTWNEETQQYEGNCTGVKLGAAQREQIFPYEYWDMDGDLDHAYTNGEVFINYCKAMNMRPRFSGYAKGKKYNADKDFTTSRGYWKLLIDRRMYGRDKQYREPQSINVANMEGDFVSNIMNRDRIEDKPVWDRGKETMAEYRKRLSEWEKQNPYYQNAEGVPFKHPSRANNPAMTKDIVAKSVAQLRHSVGEDKEVDDKYLDAVKRGDMQTAEALVRERAKLAMPNTKVVDSEGNPLVVYHGTFEGGFASFNPSVTGTYFTSSKSATEEYSITEGAEREENFIKQPVLNLSDSIDTQVSKINDYISKGGSKNVGKDCKLEVEPDGKIWLLRSKEGKDVPVEDKNGNPIVFEKPVEAEMFSTGGSRYDCYINIENPFVIDANSKSWWDLPEEINGITLPAQYKDQLHGPASTDAWATYLKSHPELGYDGVIVNNVHDTQNAGEHITDYIVFDPKDIKVVNPITRDNEGNIIPLSQRMDLTKNDVRYSLGEQKDGIREGETWLEYAQRMQQKARKSQEVQDKKGRSKEWRAAYDDVKGNKVAVEALKDTEAHDIYDVASEVLSGSKVLWEDEGEGEGKRRGAKTALGWKDGERKKFMGLWAKGDKGGMSIDELGEAVEQACRDQHIVYDDTDAMAGRNAIEEVLRGSEKRGDIKGWKESAAIQRAYEAVGEEERARDEEYMRKYGMDYHEWMEANHPEALEMEKADWLETEVKKQQKTIDDLNKSIEESRKKFAEVREKLGAQEFRTNMEKAKAEEAAKRREADIRAEEGRERFRANVERDKALAERDQALADKENAETEKMQAIAEAERSRLEAEQKGDELDLVEKARRAAEKAAKKSEQQNKVLDEKLQAATEARKTLTDAKKKLMDYVQSQVNADWMPFVGKRELSKLLAQMRDVETPEELEEAQTKVMEVAAESAVRYQQSRINKIWKMPVQGRNNKGMSVAKNVDDRTRAIVQNLAKDMKDAHISGLEDDISQLRRERQLIRDDLNKLDRGETLASGKSKEQLQQEWDAKTEQINAKQEEAWQIMSAKETQKGTEIDEEIAQLTDKQNAAANGDAYWRDVDTDRMIELGIRKLFTNASEQANNAHEMQQEILDKQAELEDMRQRIVQQSKTEKQIKRMRTDLEEAYENRQISFEEYLQQSGELFGRELDLPNIKAERKEYKTKKGQYEADINRLRRMIAEARMSQAERLGYAEQQLQELISEGHSKLKDLIEQQVQHKFDLLHNAYEAISTGKHYDTTMGNKVDHSLDALEFFKNPLYSFEYMTQKIARNERSKEGWFYNYFIAGDNGIVKAQENKLRGIHDARKQLSDKVTELWPDIKSDAEWAGGLNSWWALAEKADKIDNKTGIMVWDIKHLDENGNPVNRYEWATSKGAAMYVYMVSKMADGMIKLEKQGFDAQAIANIKDYLDSDGDKFVELADWIQDEFLPEKRAKYNAKHIEMYNTSMAKVENYVPLKVNKDEVIQQSNNELGADGMVASKKMDVKAGSLINRTFNLHSVQVLKSAFDVIDDHIEDMEDWCAFVSVRRDLDTILSSRHFQNQVDTNNHGDFIRFQDAASVACGTWQTEEESEAEKFWGAVNKRVLGVNIAWRLNTALKQLLSYPAYLGYSTNPKFLGQLIKNTGKSLFYNNMKWCYDNLPTFKERVDNGDLGNYRLSEDLRIEKTLDGNTHLGEIISEKWNKFINSYNAIGMMPNRFVDALTVSMGAKAIYDFEYNKAMDYAKDAELEGDELTAYTAKAEEQARRAADMFYNSTQQSNHPAYLSKQQVSKGILARAYSAYQNSNIAYTRMMMTGVHDFMKDIHVINQRAHYMEKYLAQGMSESDARSEANQIVIKNMWEDIRHIAVPMLLKYVWKLGGAGLLGFLTYGKLNDDDKQKAGESVEDYEARMQTEQWLEPVSDAIALTGQGMPGWNLLMNISDTYLRGVDNIELNPILGINEAEEFYKDLVKAQDKYGLFSPQVAGEILLRGGRMVGIDIQTLANIYIGVEGLMADGNQYNDWMIDVMYLLNTPKSGRRTAARALYENSKDPMEYAERIAYADGYLSRHPELVQFMPWMGGSDYLGNKKEAQRLSDEWNILQDPDYMNKKNAHKEEANAIKNATEDDIDTLMAMYDKATDPVERKTLGNKIKKLQSPSDDDLIEASSKSKPKDFNELVANNREKETTFVSKKTKPDTDNDVYNIMLTSKELVQEGQINKKLDEIHDITRAANSSTSDEYIHDKYQRDQYRRQHQETFDQLEEVNKLLKAVKESKKGLADAKTQEERETIMEAVRSDRQKVLDKLGIQ